MHQLSAVLLVIGRWMRVQFSWVFSRRGQGVQTAGLTTVKKTVEGPQSGRMVGGDQETGGGTQELTSSRQWLQMRQHDQKTAEKKEQQRRDDKAMQIFVTTDDRETMILDA